MSYGRRTSCRGRPREFFFEEIFCRLGRTSYRRLERTTRDGHDRWPQRRLGLALRWSIYLNGSHFSQRILNNPEILTNITPRGLLRRVIQVQTYLFRIKIYYNTSVTKPKPFDFKHFDLIKVYTRTWLPN